MNGRERPAPQGAVCPRCGRRCGLTIDDRLAAHSPAGDPYGTCPCDTPTVTPDRGGRIERVQRTTRWWTPLPAGNVLGGWR